MLVLNFELLPFSDGICFRKWYCKPFLWDVELCKGSWYITAYSLSVNLGTLPLRYTLRGISAPLLQHRWGISFHVNSAFPNVLWLLLHATILRTQPLLFWSWFRKIWVLTPTSMKSPPCFLDIVQYEVCLNIEFSILSCITNWNLFFLELVLRRATYTR